MRVGSPFRTRVSGYDSPKGPAYYRQSNLFLMNWLSGSMIERSPDGVTRQFFDTSGMPAGLAFDWDGTLFVAEEGEHIHGILCITPDGQATTVVDRYGNEPLNGANDLIFDRSGTLYFSRPWGSSLECPTGNFFRLPDGQLEQLAHGLALPNGVVINADRFAVFLTETGRNRILRYGLRLEDTAGERQEFAKLSGQPGPDGMAFDEAKDLYVAHHGEGRFDVFNPEGRRVDEIPIPRMQSTNVAFGGHDRKTLIVTEVSTGSLYWADMKIAGQRLLGDMDV